ncbi:MAG: hypothetical protein KBD60_10745 [Sterolibacterium sp.]|jgi:hypothetical protein|nr:hypothetical protein [Sterolibacterium sp.]
MKALNDSRCEANEAGDEEDGLPAAGPLRRDFRGRLLLLSLLRVAHLVGVVGSGAVLLGAQPLAGSEVYALVLVGSGLGILMLDRWTNPDYLRQVSGLGILLKIGLLSVAVLLAGLVEPVFWAVLVGSVLLTHAPRRVRHRLIFRRRVPPKG